MSATDNESIQATIQRLRATEHPEVPAAYQTAIDQLRARTETAEKERDQALNYLYSLGRYYGRPRETNEHVESWAGRITKAIHDNQEPMAVSVQLREECEQLQAVNAKLKAEGLAAIERAKTAERQHVDAAARADAAEKERDALRAQSDAVTAERDELRIGRGYWRGVAEDTRAALHAAKCRIADLEADDGPGGTEHQIVLHERNQLRDELAELRPQVEDLRAKLAAAEHRAMLHERDADEARRAVAVLSTIIRASVEAIARGVK